MCYGQFNEDNVLHGIGRKTSEDGSFIQEGQFIFGTHWIGWMREYDCSEIQGWYFNLWRWKGELHGYYKEADSYGNVYKEKYC